MDNTELKQNSDFITSAYRKAVFPGMLAILSVNINVFVDGILAGNRIGENNKVAENNRAIQPRKSNL